MLLASGVLLLNGRYKLAGSVLSEAGGGQLWRADDQEEWAKPYLLKAWPFTEAKPDDVQRALWDAELRTLYQMRSTPGSEDSLLQLLDVGIDYEQRCFVMVFVTEGLRTLASVLGAERPNHTWLSGAPSARRELWQMFERLAAGLALLHEQQVVHRAVSPESVFLDPDVGPESCRLGGFEWSVRLGRPVTAAKGAAGWGTPPEAAAGRATFGPDVDWFAFGMLVARTMLPVDRFALGVDDPHGRHRLVTQELAKSKNRLTPLERNFIGRLIAADPTIRLKHRSETITAIREIVRVLGEAPSTDGDQDARHVVLFSARNRGLVDACMRHGLRELLDLEAGDSFDPQHPMHVSRLQTFLHRDFGQGALLAPMPNSPHFVLSGQALHLKIGPATGADEGAIPNWQTAFCIGALDYLTTAATGQVSLPPGRIEFFSTRDRQSLGNQLTAAPSWEYVLPKTDPARKRREEHERFAEFVRLTNQIDILIRDAELFRCRVTEVKETDGLCSQISVREVAREHEPLKIFQPDGGMAEFLLREKHSGKQGSNLIYLSSTETETITAQATGPEWEMDDVSVAEGSAVLRPRSVVEDPPKVGDVLVVRTKGLHGQVQLIRRRKKAIARLEKHTYLLESLSTPGQVLMDSGLTRLPFPLSEDVADPSKIGQINKILGVRPIYALQGPPGTGKTHMVAWLLREILEEDPVAQILITAQAHPAVDVLRAKVEKEAFDGVSGDRLPLAIRLRRTGPDAPEPTDQGSEYQVTGRLLEQAIANLTRDEPEHELTNVQNAWREACLTMLAGLQLKDAAMVKEFRELVKRSASITYSTASDGDLAALAGEVSYDWSIVEEAGKVHGFELALPLYLGHRWLLIGDPKQLPPYRIEDYEKAIVELDKTIAVLEELNGVGSLLDRDVIQSWRDRTDGQRKDFVLYCQAWLRVFAKIHKLCAYHEHEEGLLTGQHRMHPDIGELVSKVYYKGRLHHYTKDPVTGEPVEDVLHRLAEPREIQGRAIVWLDLPAAVDDPSAGDEAVPKYRNPAEARALERFLRRLRGDPDRPLNLAVLSPYAQQVGYLLKNVNTPGLRHDLAAAGLRLAPDPRRLRPDDSDESRDGFFTVDSFQGNQAEIIAVSLVRNNTKAAGLGFLVEAPRMNVLLSRAERLLILVGSWDFFRDQVSYVSRDPDEYTKPQHLAFAVDYLQSMFDAGRAWRVKADFR